MYEENYLGLVAKLIAFSEINRKLKTANRFVRVQMEKVVERRKLFK